MVAMAGVMEVQMEVLVVNLFLKRTSLGFVVGNCLPEVVNSSSELERVFFPSPYLVLFTRGAF